MTEQTTANVDFPADLIYLSLESIKVLPGRARKVTVDTSELQLDLKTSPGLSNAITVNADNSLISGEHRLTAISAILELGGRFYYQGTLVPEGKVPVIRSRRQLSQLEIKRAEFGENNYRVPFTYMEGREARLEILRLQEEELQRLNPKKEEKPSVVSIEKPQKPNPFAGLQTTPRISEKAIGLAAETIFGADQSTNRSRLRKDIMVDTAIKTIPEIAEAVKKAQSEKEAIQIIERHERGEEGKRKAQEVGKTYSGENHQVFHGDCIEIMGKMTPGTFDVALVDPPFGINAHLMTKGGENHSYDDSPEAFKEFLPKMIRSLSRLLKPAAHLYLFCDFDKFHQIKAWVQDSSTPGNPWMVQRVPFIMTKTGGGIPPQPGHSARRTHEYILFAWRGGKQNTGTINDILLPVSVETKSDHGAAKQPEALIQLLRHSCKSGDSVIDCCAGEGSTMVAGHQLLLDVTLIEQDERYYGKCLEKLEALDD